MKKMLCFAVLMGALSVHAQTLDVTCEVKGPEKSLLLRMEPDADRQGAMSVSRLVVNEVNQRDLYDVSPSPSYRNGEWNIQAQFGVILGSFVSIKLQGCNSEQAQGAGQGTVDIYYGQHRLSDLNCTCTLQ